VSQATTTETRRYWDEEPSTTEDRVRIRAKIGGLHCSLCTGTIENALGVIPGSTRWRSALPTSKR